MQPLALSTAFAAALLATSPAHADPAIGFGFTYVFGGEVAVGARMFSTNKPQEAALALGLDYKFESQTFRPSVGLAYLDTDFYVDLSLGLDLGSNRLDYGIGVGGLANMQRPAAAPATGTPTGPGTGAGTGTDAATRLSGLSF